MTAHLSKRPIVDPSAKATNDPLKRGSKLLAIGEMANWNPANNGVGSHTHIVYISFNELCSDLLEKIQPDIVLSALMNPAFDCLDLALVLEQLEYRGKYRVIAPDLPRPAIISKEVRGLCKALDFALVTTSSVLDKRLN